MVKNDIDIFLPYQKKWMEDSSKMKIAEKGRRVGLSWVEAAYSVLEAAAANGQNTYYMSYNKAMTKQFVEDCAYWAHILHLAASPLGEIVIRKEDQDITMYRISFDSGKEIVGMPSDAYNLRSKQGRVVLDEAAFCSDMKGVLKAAKALLIWGGQLVVISTHNGEDNPYNELIKDIVSGREKKWSPHKIPFDAAIQQGLYKRICLKTNEVWTAAKEEAFIQEIRDIYADNIDEELFCIPARSGQKYFPRALLDRNAKKDIPIIRLELDNAFLHENIDKKTRRIQKWLEHEVLPIIRSLEGQVSIGYDIARKGDLSFAWLAEEAGQTSSETRMCIEIKNCPFTQQQLIVTTLCSELKKRNKLRGIAIDARGLGMNLAENVSIDFPGYTLCVQETSGYYAEYFPKFKALLENQDWSVPDDNTIIADFAIVETKDGIPTIPPVKTADRDGKGKRHGDGCAAALLAMYAWYESGGYPDPCFYGCDVKDIWSRS